MKVSAYLWRNRHGTWYFRAVIPQHLRHHFLQRREIRRSLQTDSRAFALRVARAARVEFDGLLDHLETTMNKKKKQVKAGLITIADLSYGNIQLKDVHIDHGDAEKEQQTLNRIISTLPSTTPQRSAAGSKLDGPLLSQVIDEFCAERVRGGNWKIKTDEEYRNGFKLLQEIISDIPVTDISRETMRAYKKTLSLLPPNMRKKPEYRDKNISEIIAMPGIAPMSVSNVNKQITRTSSLLGWANRQGYIDSNPAEQLTVKTKRRAYQERDPFTVEELKALLEGYVYRGRFPARTRPHTYQFWLPLLGLFTAARLEELCKLRCEDVRAVDDIPCLDIRESKTTAGERLVPLHKQLLDLGFLDYINDMDERGEDRLFPELNKQRDGYSQAASKWFARYRTSCGVGTTDGKKVFHSLRHSAIDCLKQQEDVKLEHIRAIAGHSQGDDQTAARYGKAFGPGVIVNVVNRIDYPGLDLCHVNYDDFQRRREGQGIRL